MELTPDFIDKTRSWFEISLNEHGYSFQQSILKAAHDLCSQNKSGWSFQATEFPVEVRGRGTRIDIVLQRANLNDGTFSSRDKATTIMLAECKRANPAYANWCFVKSSYTSRGQYSDSEALIFEKINPCSEVIRQMGGYDVKDVGRCRAMCEHHLVYMSSQNVFHIGLEVKTNTKGNAVATDPGKDAIENAASQICQGLSGMVNFLSLHDELWEHNPPVHLVPVIFTTANLWTSDADLSKADLQTGNSSFEDHNFKQVPWLIYQYCLSPGIKHAVPSKPAKNNFADMLQANYKRSIAVVNPDGMEDFFRYATKLDFTD